MPTEVAADGNARAGAAFSRRREQLGISVRGLAERRVIAASQLIAFEKGRRWPRKSTLQTLEEVAGWPAGTLEAIRAGADPPADATPVVTTVSAGGAVGDVIAMVKSVLAGVDAAVDRLPDGADPTFTEQVSALLGDLRQVQVSILSGMRGGHDALGLLQALAVIQDRYDDLAAQAAAAPTATLGQRLYDVRRRLNIGVPAVAAALALPTVMVTAAEADEPLDDATEARLAAALGALEAAPIPSRRVLVRRRKP